MKGKQGGKEEWKGRKKNGEEERGERYLERSEERWQNNEKKKRIKTEEYKERWKRNVWRKKARQN
jgi:hypothetical protein